MACHPLTQVVNNFYTELNEKCNFKTRINSSNLSQRVNKIIDDLGEETMKRYYGSGFIIPNNLEGARILDLGCGSGSLVFILSKLVGPSGFILGVDICEALIKTAEKESEYHVKKWGYDKPNFKFQCASIESLSELGQPEESFDIIVSNGVFCLCPDQRKVFEQTYRMLKPGGEFLHSDVYAEMEQPKSLLSDNKLWALGTTGSLVWSKLAPLVESVGFTTPYLLQTAGVDIKNEEIKKTLSNAEYVCAGWRMFKLPPGAKRGAATVTYKGNIEDYEELFPFSIDLTFKKGQPTKIDTQLATILSNSSYSQNFDITDCSDEVETPKNQNPFEHLRRLAKTNHAPSPAYDIE